MLKVDTACMEMQAQQMQEIANKLNDIASRVASVNRKLRWNTSIAASVRSNLAAYSSTVSALDDKASVMAHVLRSADQQYQDCETAAAQNVAKASAAQQKTNSGKYHSWWEELKEKAGDFADRVKDDISYGVAKTVLGVSCAVSWLIDEYDKKGVLFKAVNTGKAVIGAAAGIVSVAAMIGLTASTGGVALPLLAVSCIYAGTDLVDAGYDLYNCWSDSGDLDEVGQSVLQDMLVDKLGETVGGGLYTIGDAVYTVTNIFNKVDLAVESAFTFLEYSYKGYEAAREKQTVALGGG